jgi:hypothetical protein
MTGPQFHIPRSDFTPAYRVTAPLVLVKDAGGLTHHCYQGALLEWLSDEQAELFLHHGLVERIGEPVTTGSAPSDAKPKPADRVK